MWIIPFRKQICQTGKSQLFSSVVEGAEGRHEQRRVLRTKALMRDLGTKLECRQRVFVRTGKNIVEVNQ